MKQPPSTLSLERLEMMVYLGCSAEERKQRQKIEISISVHFSELPKTCSTDELSPELGYDAWANQIEAYLDAKEFKTIEKLGYDLFNLLKPSFSSNEKLYLRLHKLHPPMKQNNGGAVFELGPA